MSSVDNRIWLVALNAAINAAGDTVTLRYGSEGYATRPGDTPAHTFFEPRLKQPALVRRDIYREGATAGESRVSVGEVVLVNNDGGLDGLIDYGFDGRRITLYTGLPDATFPAAWEVVLAGTMEQVSITESEVSIRIRDRQAELDVPASANEYAGNNALPAGLEGVEDDLKDQTKPRAFGKVRNVSPPLVNTARLIYQVNDGAIQSVDAVYDMGVALTAGAAYTSQTDMETNAPAAGAYRVWPAGGYFRVGSTPAGLITADVTASTTANSTAAQIVKQLALDAGIDAADISSADVTALDTATSAVLGLWLPAGDTSTCRQAIDRVCAAVGAWFSFDVTGILRLARLDVPSGSPVAELDSLNMVSLKRVPTADPGRGVPAWKVAVSGTQNWTVQTTDLAGAVTTARRGWLKKPFRWRIASDASVKTQHRLAPLLKFETLLDTGADVAAEASRRLTIYKTRRDRLEVRVYLSSAQLGDLDLGHVVRVTSPRFGLAAGRLFRVIGILINARQGYADLTLWG